MADFSIKVIDPSRPIHDTKTYLIELVNNIKSIKFSHNLENITNIHLNINYKTKNNREKSSPAIPSQGRLIKDTHNHAKEASLVAPTQPSMITEQNVQTKTQERTDQILENKPSNIVDSSFYEKKFDRIMDQQSEINEDFHSDEAKLFPLNDELNHQEKSTFHQLKWVEQGVQTQIFQSPQSNQALEKALTELATQEQVDQDTLKQLRQANEALEQLLTELITRKQTHQKSLEKLQAELTTQKKAHQEAQTKLTAQVQSSQEALDKAHIKLTEQEKVNQDTLEQLQQANNALEQLQHDNKALDKTLTALIDLEMNEQEDQIITDLTMTPASFEIDEQEVQTQIQQTTQLIELANAELSDLEIEKKEILENIHKETQDILVAKLELVERETERKKIQAQIQEEAEAIKQNKEVLNQHAEILLKALTNDTRDIQASIVPTLPEKFIEIEKEIYHLPKQSFPFSYMNKYNKDNDNYDSDNLLKSPKKPRFSEHTVNNHILSEKKHLADEENPLASQNKRLNNLLEKTNFPESTRKTSNDSNKKYLVIQNKISEMIDEIPREEKQSKIQTKATETPIIQANPYTKIEQGVQTEILVRKDLAIQTEPVIIIAQEKKSNTTQGTQTVLPIVTEKEEDPNITQLNIVYPPLKNNTESIAPVQVKINSVNAKGMTYNKKNRVQPRKLAPNRKVLIMTKYTPSLLTQGLPAYYITKEEYDALNKVKKSILPPDITKEIHALLQKIIDTPDYSLPKMSKEEYKILKQILNSSFYQKEITTNLPQSNLIAAVPKIKSSNKKSSDDEDEEQDKEEDTKKDPD